VSYKFNPFTGTLDDVGPNNGNGVPGGSDTQVQFNDNGVFGGDSDFTWDDTSTPKVLGIGGDINLDDGGTYTTTLQTITPTAARTISFPDATGTVGLVGGSSGNLVVNQSGAYTGVANSSVDNATGNITLGSRFISSLNGALSATGIAGVPVAATGTWITGGTATTTKPQVLIEPTGTTSTGWSTSGTGLGVNAASTFTGLGRLIDLQVNGSSKFYVDNNGGVAAAYLLGAGTLFVNGNSSNGVILGNYAGYGIFLGSDTRISWNNGSPQATRDLTLVRDAAGILAQRNGTNAQTSRVYNTFTDASNYERGFLRWSSNVFEVGPEAAGTGIARPMRITAATLKLPNLPTYADNTAALAGSLVAGDVYKTATGELRITV
jgi:hypothetical protein